jgi:hypothetical protein
MRPSDRETAVAVQAIPGTRRLLMKLVSREMVEKAGVNVDELLKLLVSNAAAELTTFYY